MNIIRREFEKYGFNNFLIDKSNHILLSITFYLKIIDIDELVILNS